MTFPVQWHLSSYCNVSVKYDLILQGKSGEYLLDSMSQGCFKRQLILPPSHLTSKHSTELRQLNNHKPLWRPKSI